MKYWKSFIDKRIGLTAVYDILFYAIIIPSIMLYAFVVNRQSHYLADVLGKGDIQSYLLSASQAEVALATANLRAFVLTFIIGAIVVFLVGLFSYSLSRTLIWNYLLKKKFSVKKYLKMNVLNIILMIALLIIFVLYSLLLLINRTIFGIIFLFFALAVIYFMFALYTEYTLTGRIFYSIGNAFKMMDKRVYLLSMPVFIIIGLITVGIGLVINEIASIIISIILIVLFMSWMRIFVLRTSKKKNIKVKKAEIKKKMRK